MTDGKRWLAEETPRHRLVDNGYGWSLRAIVRHRQLATGFDSHAKGRKILRIDLHHANVPIGGRGNGIVGNPDLAGHGVLVAEGCRTSKAGGADARNLADSRQHRVVDLPKSRLTRAFLIA